MPTRKSVLLAAAALAALLVTFAALAAEPPRPAAQSAGPVYVLRAYVDSRETLGFPMLPPARETA